MNQSDETAPIAQEGRPHIPAATHPKFCESLGYILSDYVLMHDGDVRHSLEQYEDCVILLLWLRGIKADLPPVG